MPAAALPYVMVIPVTRAMTALRPLPGGLLTGCSKHLVRTHANSVALAYLFVGALCMM